MMEQGYWQTHQSRALAGYRKHIQIFTEAMQAYPRRMEEGRFLKETETEFIGLLPRLPLHPGSKKHLFNELMPALATISAAYIVLKNKDYSTDQIGRLQYEGYLQYFNKIPRPVRWLARQLMVSSAFPRLMCATSNKMRESRRGDTFFIEYAFQKKPRRATTMNCTQCAMVTFMEENRLQEMKRICNVFDFAQAGSFGLGLKQPACIGQGAPTCQYIFTTDREDTVLPQNMIEIINTPMDI